MRLPTGRIVEEASGRATELPELGVLGRSPEATVAIPDPRASRRHALIRRSADGFWFNDLGSVNGSTVNGRRVTTALRLQHGDRIMIAGHAFRFEGDGASEPGMQTLGDPTIAEIRPSEAVLLVSDIWSFTALSEKVDVDPLAQIMGSWYSRTGDVLNEAGATIDKFIGDCVLAYWLDTSNRTRKAALEAAVGLSEVARMVQSQHAKVFQSIGMEFRTGVAVHVGAMVYGAFGSGEFTLIGDAVNLAFRLESMTRPLDAPVLLSANVLDGWEDGRENCRPLGSHSVKGRAEPVEVWRPA
ncbi:adenylatecyclase [Haloferula helveola]|uniref:Adenylatecyclase n=1 Tax=Haloferula helveola TaxID=490095 RepID=A0ABM7R9A8_9BACT|nr:adenylatecyclase [Haloferula helveola]